MRSLIRMFDIAHVLLDIHTVQTSETFYWSSHVPESVTIV